MNGVCTLDLRWSEEMGKARHFTLSPDVRRRKATEALASIDSFASKTFDTSFRFICEHVNRW